ncbi:MAG: MCE family protein [Proteobacteria bacterium]|nr:MCE family protein [Pseudomonadota bacterium]
MIQRSNPRVIGGFVLGALALMVSAVLVFGSGQFFRKYDRAVIFFQGTVGGLRVGAPVDLRGVQIGSVQEISIQYDLSSGQSAIPVVIEIDPNRVATVGRSAEDTRFSIERMVERGLRAELRLQSFVTGQMAVQLNFNSRIEARLVGSDLPYPEIPAIPSTFEQAQEILTELARSAPEMLQRLNLVLDRAANVLGELSDTAPAARQLVTDLGKFSAALGESDRDVRTLLAMLAKLSGSLDTTALEFGETGKRLNRILADNDGPIKNMIAQFGKTGTGLTQLTDKLNLIAQDNREGLKDFTTSGLYDLTNLIRDTQELVGNLNRTIDDLRRNPSQFLFGQQQREVPANRARAP